MYDVYMSRKKRFFLKNNSADLESKLNSNISEAVGAFMSVLDLCFTSITNFVVVFLLVSSVDHLACLLIGLPFPLFFMEGKRFSKLHKENTTARIVEFSRFKSHILQRLMTNDYILTNKLHEGQRKKFIDRLINLNEIQKKGAVDSAFNVSLFRFISSLSIVLMIGHGGYLLSTGTITVGEFLILFNLSLTFSEPVTQLVLMNKQLSTCISASQRIEDHLTDMEEKYDERFSGKYVDIEVEEIELRNVGFRFEGGSSVLDDISFHVCRGEVVAFVGESGCGKTTLANIITRQLLETSGQVCINGENAEKLLGSDLISTVGFVTQEPVIFDDTLRNNLLSDVKYCDEQEMVAMLDKLRLKNLLKRLPEGLDTELGERGSQLSVGEKQRITIARALLRKPQILLLDEATSALDMETERIVSEELKENRNERITFMIAHRLHTLDWSDKIIYIERGKIVEVGRHEDLLERKGKYAALWGKLRSGVPRNSII